MLYTVPRDAAWRDCAATLWSLENLFPRPHFQAPPTSGNSCGLVAWVYPRRLPWLACTLSSAASGRQRCGVVLLPSACRGSEAVSEQQHPWEGKMHDPFRWQVLGSQAAMHLTLSCSARENHCGDGIAWRGLMSPRIVRDPRKPFGVANRCKTAIENGSNNGRKAVVAAEIVLNGVAQRYELPGFE